MFNKYLWESTIKNIKNTKFIVIDMIRLSDNKCYNENMQYFTNFEKHEPQVAFHNSTKTVFNEDFIYGRLPKVELLKHLKVKGKWDKWNLISIEKKFFKQRKPIDINYEKKGLVLRINTSNETNLNQLTRTLKEQKV